MPIRPRPFYDQVAETLVSEIEAGIYPPGSRLPGEISLSRRFGLNRHTVRAGLRRLVERGYIYRARGKGTFVALRKIPYRINQRTRYSARIRSAGFEPQAELLGAEALAADVRVAGALGLEEETPVWELRIRRFVENIPLGHTRSYLPVARFPGLPDRLRGNFSLYRALETGYGIEACRSQCVIETSMPTDEDLELLQMPGTVPVLISRSQAVDAEGRPVEWCVTRGRGDLLSLEMDLSRPADAASGMKDEAGTGSREGRQ